MYGKRASFMGLLCPSEPRSAKHGLHQLCQMLSTTSTLRSPDLIPVHAAAAVATTVVALLLPVREVAVGGRIVDSQYLIILASMVLWGISMGATPVLSFAMRAF